MLDEQKMARRAEIDRSLWMGRAISEMSRGELLDVIGR